MLKTKESKGITLIALIITIIVLLILAGVTISAISGNESAMEKATEAKEKNEQGAELDAIKLAVVNSVASDLTGLVNAENLKEGLNGIVEDEGRLKINQDNSPWIVTGKTGMKYKINQNGEVTSAEPVATVEFVSTTDEIAVSKSKKLSIIARGASGNTTEANEVTFASSNTDLATVEEDGSIKIVNDESKIGQTVTISVIADGINGGNTCNITIVKLIKPKVGDFVNYSAGKWSTEDINALSSLNINGSLTDVYVPNGEIPSENNTTHKGKFGGFFVDKSRDETVNGNGVNKYASGWQILEMDSTQTYITKIIHAGTPEIFYYNGYTYSVNVFNARNWNVYRDELWADNTKDVMLLNYQINGEFGPVGQSYIINSSSTGSSLNYIGPTNDRAFSISRAQPYGIRPVVCLKSGVTGSGEGLTHNSPDKAWSLTQ